jgi:GWxTD domain-containing protein
MRFHLLLLILLLACRGVVPAQPGPDPRLRYGDLIYAEAAAMPSDSAGMTRIDVFVRVSYDFMVFTKSDSRHPDSLYSAGAEITCDLRQSKQTLRSRIQNARVAVRNFEDTNMRDRFVLLRQTFHVPAGTYEAAVFVSDMGSTRQSSVQQRITTRPLSEKVPHFGEPIPLARESHEGGESYSVLGFSRTLPFAERTLIGIPVTPGFEATWNIQLIPDNGGEDEREEPVFNDTVQPLAQIAGLTPDGQAGIVSDYHLHAHPGAAGDLVILSLPSEGLDVGPYHLVVTAYHDGSADSLTIPTEIFWRDMPFSLREIEFAVDAMRFILTEEEYREMKRGDTRDMQKSFRRFWKERDATPETEYNEMMAEYFRRVDQAYYKFQTIYERNGAQTDRGKVYVLFGPPEDTRRLMQRDEPITEIWSYASLGKTFRFVDKNRDGNLRLMEE